MRILAFFRAVLSRIEASWLGGLLWRFFTRRDVSAVLHCAFLIGMMVYVRPMFSAAVPRQSYEARTIIWDLVQRDVNAIVAMAAGKRGIGAPRILFLVIPTLLLLLRRRSLKWTRWEGGRTLRLFIFAFLLPLAWTAGPGLTEAVWFVGGLLVLVGTVMVVRVAAAHREAVPITQRTWPPGSASCRTIR